ncbi:hypothetical protein [Bacillus suaedaesalsae]|uniref:Uncharacterized protein n=1 Tax=Bacillus suaedaesalsae TaxID=2810349 RepID=A0ABS2DK19_9BACI|nr:hypothetical protein [Bacillus suaedaesalsae]MBM6618845.1 hypothetical protein [Bacillus suaedaesalsae]
MKRKRHRNYMYEVEVKDSNEDQEFALELFEMIEDAAHFGPNKKINTFDELLQWNEQLDEDE